VDVAVLVIEHSPALDRFLGHGQVDGDDAVFVRRGRLDSQFQRVEHAAGIPVGHIDQVIQRFRMQIDLQVAIATFPVIERLEGDGSQVFLGQRAQAEKCGCG
jgi:hypothetical protein